MSERAWGGSPDHEERLGEAEEASQDETDAAVLETTKVVQIGLGWFWSIKGLLAVLFSVLFVAYAIERLIYALKSQPREVAEKEAGTVRHNDFVRLTATLDYDQGLAVETIGGQKYTLVPVVGTNCQLIVYQRGSFIEGELTDKPRTFVGRVVGQDWTDEWDLQDGYVDVIAQFDRKGIAIPEGALLLDVGYTPKLDIWITLLGVVGFGILAWFVHRLTRTLGFLQDRSRLADYVNKASL